jgi:hypothetical protein
VRLAGVGLVLALTACTSAHPTPVSAPAPATVAAPVTLSAPQWRPGDRWVYDWTSGTEKGTKTIEVSETKAVNAVSYFVLRLEDVENYYTKDLHWAAAVRESRVEARMVPPQPWFMWPLVAKQQWDHQGTFEDASGSRTFNDHFTVVGVEEIEVPAGKFQTMKVMREGERRDSDEYWYSADVRWYVRWVGRRGDVTFEERLKEYRPGRR